MEGCVEDTNCTTQSSRISLPSPRHILGTSVNIGVEEGEHEHENEYNGLLVVDWGEETEDEDRPLDTVSQLATAIPLGNIHNSTSSSARLVFIDPDEMGIFPGAPANKEDWEAQDISPEIGEWPGCQELLRIDNIY
ncbi:hypothetical protein K3495_g5059 [Podosphaera aphanis]|nr:hypothetical protein K3495_g5059 [Podosphaera aphanis]